MLYVYNISLKLGEKESIPHIYLHFPVLDNYSFGKTGMGIGTLRILRKITNMWYIITPLYIDHKVINFLKSY